MIIKAEKELVEVPRILSRKLYPIEFMPKWEAYNSSVLPLKGIRNQHVSTT